MIDPTIEIAQINHFYPYGLNMDGNWNGASPNVKNKYQYNGKELQTDFGLDWNDYGARMYDATIGRWNAVDPMAGKYLRYSPYNYCKVNPIKFIDPDGMQVQYDWDAHNKGQKGVYKDNGAAVSYSRDLLLGGERSFKANMVNEAKMSSTALVRSVQYAQDIYFKNGISITFSVNIMSKKDALSKQKYSKHDAELFLSIKKSASVPGVTSHNNYGDVYTTQDGKNLSTFVDWGYANKLASKKGGNSEYILGYLIAHEFLHQLLSKAKDGYYDSHTDEANSYGLPKNELGNNVLNTPNLNMSRPYVENDVPADWSLTGRPAEEIIPIHIQLLKTYYNAPQKLDRWLR